MPYSPPPPVPTAVSGAQIWFQKRFHDILKSGRVPGMFKPSGVYIKGIELLKSTVYLAVDVGLSPQLELNEVIKSDLFWRNLNKELHYEYLRFPTTSVWHAGIMKVSGKLERDLFKTDSQRWRGLLEVKETPKMEVWDIKTAAKGKLTDYNQMWTIEMREPNPNNVFSMMSYRLERGRRGFRSKRPGKPIHYQVGSRDYFCFWVRPHLPPYFISLRGQYAARRALAHTHRTKFPNAGRMRIKTLVSLDFDLNSPLMRNEEWVRYYRSTMERLSKYTRTSLASSRTALGAAAAYRWR